MLKIIIKSFFICEINSYINIFLNNIKKKYISKSFFIFPKKIKKFTFLVSPHVDKNSRDQMQLEFYKAILYLKYFDNKILKYLIKNMYIDGLNINYYFL